MARRRPRLDSNYVQTRDSRRPRPLERSAVGQADLFNDRRPPGNGESLRGPSTLTEPLLDAREAADLLKVPRSALYELVRSRGLPHVRVGSRGLRFVRSDLARWVADNTYGRP